MSLIWRCDRCGKEMPPVGMEHRPSGWLRVEGADLCETCQNALHAFLRPLPKAHDILHRD